MMVEGTSRYGADAVTLSPEALRNFEQTVRQFLADPQIMMALRSAPYLASPHFQHSFYRPVPPDFLRKFFDKDTIEHGTFEEGTYGHWICLLEFLLRMTGKEIIFNADAWDAYSDAILTVSPLHEQFKFLVEGLKGPKASVASRGHFWAGEAMREEIDAHVGDTGNRCRVLLAQPVGLCSLKDGWGVRNTAYRETHRYAAGIGILFDPAGMEVPAEKRRRGYAHQFSLQELIARYGHVPRDVGMIRRAMEGLDWSLRRLALFTRKRMREVLSAPEEAVCAMTVCMDALYVLRRDHTVQFALNGTEPIRFGDLASDAIGFDPDIPLPLERPVAPDTLKNWLTRGEAGKRPIDALLGVIASARDSDAHHYWEARQLSSEAATHWAQTLMRPSHGQWF